MTTKTKKMTFESLAREGRSPQQALILMHMQQRAKKEHSASSLSKEVTELPSLGATSHHVRVLAGEGLIVETRKERRRGAYETFYKLASAA